MAATVVLLNARAGAMIDRGGDDPAGDVARGFEQAGRQVDVRLCQPDEMARCMDEAVAAGAQEIIVGGGDGTVSMAVQKLAGSGTALGILPFGTLNLLARDLGIPLEFDAAVAALAEARPVAIDLGRINGRPFHTISGLGYFGEVARAREEARGLKLPFGLGRWLTVLISTVKALLRTRPMRLDITADGQTRRVKAYALLVTNNAYGDAGWQRPRLDAGILELHVAHEAALADKLKAGVDLLSDAWRDNPGIESITATEIRIARPPRVKLWVATDGELAREPAPLDYEIWPNALTVLAPPPAPGGAV